MTDTAEAAWARIVPFLRPIEGLIRDPEVSDILVNGERGVFFEKQGRLVPLLGISISEKSLQVAARNIAELSETRFLKNALFWILDCRMARVWRLVSHLGVGTALAIRKFQTRGIKPTNWSVSAPFRGTSCDCFKTPS